MALEWVARIEDVPEERGLRIQVQGRDLALFRVGDDFYAIDNACPHAGFPLADGLLEGPIVICTAHGWEFDVRTGLAAGTYAAPLGCYKVRREGDDLLIEVGENDAAP